MKLDIEIEPKDMGFRYDAIKSLLKKFEPLEEHKNELEEFKISLATVKEKEQYHELGGALIWRLSRHYQSLPCRKNIKYSKELQSFLDQRHFMDRLTGLGSNKYSDLIPIHYESFTPSRSGSVEEVYNESIKNTFNKDNLFHNEVKTQISEIITNSFDHSEFQSEAGIICVKSEDQRYITVCVVDRGQGIRQSFLSNPLLRDSYIELSEEQAIAEAVKKNISCNPWDAKHPNYPNTANGGVGLYFLNEFVKHHRNSQLVIVSGKGYYLQDGNNRNVIRNFVNTRWPGTLVYFRVELDQEISATYKDLGVSYLNDEGHVPLQF